MNHTAQNSHLPGIEPATTNHSSGAQRNDAIARPTFMDNHPIDTIGGQNPIFSPFQFLYPLENHHVKEIDSYKFQKTKLSIKCVNEDYVFTVYNTLKHIAASFNILLRPLEENLKNTGIFQLSIDNCIGYENAKDIMSTTLHLKLTGSDYFNPSLKPKPSSLPQRTSVMGSDSSTEYSKLFSPDYDWRKGGFTKQLVHPATTI